MQADRGGAARRPGLRRRHGPLPPSIVASALYHMYCVSAIYYLYSVSAIYCRRFSHLLVVSRRARLRRGHGPLQPLSSVLQPFIICMLQPSIICMLQPSIIRFSHLLHVLIFGGCSTCWPSPKTRSASAIYYSVDAHSVFSPKKEEGLVGWLDGWMVGWLDGWMVGWLDGWMARLGRARGLGARGVTQREIAR